MTYIPCVFSSAGAMATEDQDHSTHQLLVLSLVQGPHIERSPQINSSTNTAFYFMIASIVVAPSVDSYSGPNKCPGRVTWAPVLDGELRQTLKLRLAAVTWNFTVRVCKFHAKVTDYIFFILKKIFQKNRPFWASIIPLGVDSQWQLSVLLEEPKKFVWKGNRNTWLSAPQPVDADVSTSTSWPGQWQTQNQNGKVSK